MLKKYVNNFEQDVKVKSTAPALFLIRHWFGAGSLIVLYLVFSALLLSPVNAGHSLLLSPLYWLFFVFWVITIITLRSTSQSYIILVSEVLTLFSAVVGLIFLDNAMAGISPFILSMGITLVILTGYLFLFSNLWQSIPVGILATLSYFAYLYLYPEKLGTQTWAVVLPPLLADLFGILYYAVQKKLEAKLTDQKEQIDQLLSKAQMLKELQNDFASIQNQNVRQQDMIKDLQAEVVDLKNLLQLEQSLTNLAIRFIQAPTEDTDAMINNGLKTLCRYFDADRAYLYFFAKNGTVLNKSHEYRNEGVKEKIARHEKVDNEDFSWFMKALKRQTHLEVIDIEQLPLEASTLKSIWKVEEVKSLYIVPLSINDAVVGFIGLDALSQHESWPSFTERTLNTAGLIFLNALDRKHSREHLRRSEGRLRLLFERSADVVYVTTPQGKIVDMNPAGVKLFGYKSIDEVLKLNVRELYWNSEDRNKFQEIMEKHGFVKDFEVFLKDRQGKKLIALITANAIKNDQNQVVAYEGIMRDITEKKQLEQQLFQAQKMESIGLLTGSIAHDFNNILTAVNGYAEMIRRGLPHDHPQLVHVHHILRAGRRAENLIRQLLAFSRKQIIEPRIVNINQIINDLRKMLRQLISEDIDLHTELNENLPQIKADPGQIEQVLVNLIVNSRDALNQVGDPKLKKYIKIQTQEVTLDANFVMRHPGSRDGKFIRISISDNGIGIPETIQTKIFEPFFTTKDEGKGTGLGLSTVYGIIKQNDGSIYLESEEGRGTTFHIYWPITEEKEDESEHDETSDVTTKAEEVVLVAEDDMDVRELACAFLTNLGYKVYEAENGVKALELIKKQNLIDKIDLLFSDMVMPEMGGDQLAQEIKRLNPKIKILLTSGYTDSQLMKSGLWNKGFHFLHKPYTIQQMAKKVRKVLDSAAGERSDIRSGVDLDG